ncbi:hypothetical protein AYO20_01473 [Fonsecaea nubica]|uniref:Uncharacterized protein n=1 Tax=Fonsecaea nubica TaxID=856822 RepID=A0A178DDK5_9EURO|nr:hypothetical protein AYO20_01473 [Fonsecaea nubica]OAL39155.1 hypothetical protein AYO20_01473 [Fonsecaea nubica]
MPETEKASRREQSKQLVAERGDSLVMATSRLRGENFLHFLASSQEDNRSPSTRLAVQKLVARMLLHPGGMNLLVERDGESNTPLHTAIQRSNHDFLCAVSGEPRLPLTVKNVRQTIEKGKATWVAIWMRNTFLHDALYSRSLLADNKLLLAIISLAPDDMLLAQDIHGRTPLHLAVEYSKCTPGRLEIVRELISRRRSVLQKKDFTGHSPHQYHVLSIQASHSGSKALDTRAAEPDFKLIKDELKLESLRDMSCDAAYRCLYIPNEKNQELWFDYMPAPSTDMTFAQFESHWNKLYFETTLKYVSIANIKFKPDKDDDRVVSKGRNDATRILGWLQSKCVKRILHVIVDDMKPNYRSYDAIGRALARADVEILDWRRPDLCPSTIFKIGKNLKELYLYWGGNNAILRAWSEAEGLPMLARYGKLSKIFIFSPEDSPDLSSNIAEQLKGFDDRLIRNWSQVAEKRRPQSQERSAILDDSATLASGSLRPDSGPLRPYPAGSQVSMKHEVAADREITGPQIIHLAAKTSLKSKPADNDRPAAEMDQHRWMQGMENFMTAFLRSENAQREAQRTTSSRSELP